MTTGLATKPAAELTDSHLDVNRMSLAELADLGAEELAAQLQRVLPGTATGQVAVAAFQSSI